jgi:hypothetical protein
LLVLSSIYIFLVHLDKAAGAVFRTFLAAIAEFQFKLVRFALDQRLDDGVVLTVTPAIAAVETFTTAHTSLRFGQGLVLRPGLDNFDIDTVHTLIDR